MELHLPLGPLLLIPVVFVAVGLCCLYLKAWLTGQLSVRQTSCPTVNVYPYHAKTGLLSRAEHTFYRVLHHCLLPDEVLFCQVRLADFIDIDRNSGNWQRYFNQIQSKSVDFLICDADTLTPRLVIELDDASHQRADRKKRDHFLANLCLAANLPLLRIPVQYAYTASELKLAIREKLQRSDSDYEPTEPNRLPSRYVNGRRSMALS